MKHNTILNRIIRPVERLLTIIGVVVCICTASLVNGANIERVYGASSETSQKRLSTETNRMWLDGKGKLKVTLLNRTEADTVEITAKAPKAVKISVGEWEGDTCTVELTPLKNKNTYLYISSGSETVKVRLFMTKGTVLSGEQIYERAFDAMVEIRTVDSAGEEYVGSGFFIGDRLILSNHHVVSAASYIEIYDYYGKQYTVKAVRYFDEKEDLILFEVRESNKSAFTFADSVKGGETAYSVGSPVGLTGTFVHGIVANPSQAMYDVDEETGEKTLNHYVQVSIPNGTGCGGGPIVNSRGQVIGVSTLTITSSQNISLAIGCEKVRAFLANADGSRAMTLKEFCKLNKGKFKESNLYEFSVQGSIRDRADLADDNTGVSAGGNQSAAEMSAEDIYADAYDAMAEVWINREGKEGFNGSGFFISQDTVVTCNHVVNEYPIAYVKDYNGNEYKVIGSIRKSANYDIALLTVEPKQDNVSHGIVRINANYVPVVGEKVYTFGSPAGFTASMSEGVISMSRRDMMNIEAIQFDGAITGGNSGGALFNRYGEVIGVTFATVTISEHDNFALPVRYIGMAE